MITSLSKKMEKRKRGKRERKEGKGKKARKKEKQGKRLFLAHTGKYAKPFWEKSIFFPQGERISYFFPKGKEYHIFSPNSIYQKNMHNLFGERISYFNLLPPQ